MTVLNVLGRVPTDRITREARDIRFWRTVLALVAAVLFGVGWLAVAWTATAVKVGWQEGRKPHPVR